MDISTEYSLPEGISILARTPAALSALLRGLPDVWLRRNEGGESWDAAGIVGHLLYLERNDWLRRVRIILESGELRPFEPLDRFAQREEIQNKPSGQLLDEFALVRRENLASVEAMNLQTADLARRGTHPALGTVTLSQLLATWTAHDLTHLHQLSRVMAHQYRRAVGPWKAYLGVMQCAGHSGS